MPKAEENTCRVPFFLPPKAKAALDSAAKRQGTTTSALVRQIVILHLERFAGYKGE